MAITKIGTPELFDFSATNTALQLPTGPTSGTGGRPSNPSTGEWRFNTTLKYVEFWDGGAWRQIDTEELPSPDDFPSQNFNVNTYFGTGAIQTIDAKFNEAANFNGSSSYITTNYLISGNPNSFSFWVNASSGSTRRVICGDFNAVTGGDGRILIELNASNQVMIYIAGSSGTLWSGWSPQSFTSYLNSWTNLVVTVSGTTIKLYLNGSLISTQTSGQTMAAGANGLMIGGYGQTFLLWNGKIDQVRLFNTTLTDAQAEDLYTDETTTTAATLNFPAGAGCIAAYQLDGDASDVGGTYGGVETNIGYTGLRFQPDFVWIKDRDTTGESHRLTDSVRGATKALYSNGSFAEGTESNGLTSFNSNSFTVGNNTAYNNSTKKYVAWNWKAGGAPTATNSQAAGAAPTPDSVLIDGVSSTAALAGTLPAKNISANTAAGFSIVSYTGTGNTATVGHGIDAPEMIIAKSTSDAYEWKIWHKNLSSGYQILFNNAPQASDPTVWTTTTPTSTVFSVGTNVAINQLNKTYIAYCFHSVAGYQKIGSYTGNNGTNTISTEITSGDGGFEPAFLLIKNIAAGSTNNWILLDNKRSPVNQRKQVLEPNTSDNETTETVNINFLTNGFQLTDGNSSVNDNGNTYIYLAIAADKDSSVPTQANSFSTTLYDGTGAVQNVYTPFAPDFTWMKGKSFTDFHSWLDSVRGPFVLGSTQTGAESAFAGFKFNPNGFTVPVSGQANPSGQTLVSWNWKAGGLPTINNDGSITSIVSANQNAGFSIVQYRGTGSNATIGHGLGAIPELIIDKVYDSNAGYGWTVYSQPSGTGKYLTLNSNAIQANDANFCSAVGIDTITSYYTSSPFDHIAYFFTSKPGYSKIGSFSGSSSAGNFQNIGFTPTWIMIKAYQGAGSDWYILDNKRPGGNTTREFLGANLNGGTYNASETNAMQFVTNGFQFGGASFNTSGYDYIYLAIKEN